jgi:hypothetical protein
MGAATSIHYLGREDLGKHREKVKCAVLDSGFSNLRLVVDSLAGGGKFMGALAGIMFPMIGYSVNRITGLEIDMFKPKDWAEKLTHDVPALFLQAEGDTLIVPQHTYENYDAYSCE